jgi:hypothetical protein
MRTSHPPSLQSSCPLLSCWRAAAAPPAAAAAPLQQAASSGGGGEGGGGSSCTSESSRRPIHDPQALLPSLAHHPTAHRGRRPLQGRFGRLPLAFCCLLAMVWVTLNAVDERFGVHLLRRGKKNPDHPHEAWQMQFRASEARFNPFVSMGLDHDCTARVLLAAGTLPGGSSFSLWELCRLQCVNRTFRHAALEVRCCRCCRCRCCCAAQHTHRRRLTRLLLFAGACTLPPAGPGFDHGAPALQPGQAHARLDSRRRPPGAMQSPGPWSHAPALHCAVEHRPEWPLPSGIRSDVTGHCSQLSPAAALQIQPLHLPHYSRLGGAGRRAARPMQPLAAGVQRFGRRAGGGPPEAAGRAGALLVPIRGRKSSEPGSNVQHSGQQELAAGFLECMPKPDQHAKTRQGRRLAHVACMHMCPTLQLSGSCGALCKLYLRGCHAVCDDVCRQLPRVEELDLAFTSVTGADPGTRICSTTARSFLLHTSVERTFATCNVKNFASGPHALSLPQIKG